MATGSAEPGPVVAVPGNANLLPMALIACNSERFPAGKAGLTPSRLAEAAVGVSTRMNKFDVAVNVRGGGLQGQAGAVRHGIARALLKVDANLRPALKSDGLLTRDPRTKERKKYGQPGARKRFQYSKR